MAADGPEALEALEGSDPTPSRGIAARELLERVRSMLTDDERFLADQRGLGREWADIAREVGGSPGALRERVARAVGRAGPGPWIGRPAAWDWTRCGMSESSSDGLPPTQNGPSDGDQRTPSFPCRDPGSSLDVALARADGGDALQWLAALRADQHRRWRRGER